MLQWLFGAKGNPRYARRLADLEERMDTLERKHRSLDGEWAEWYDKSRHMMGRLAKRAAIMQESTEEPEEAPEPAAPEPSDGLTPNQRRIQNAILAARGIRTQ